MNLAEPVVIIGAEISGLDFHANDARTAEMRSELLSRGLGFVGVTHVTEGNKEQAFLVVTKDEEGMRQLAKLFGQKYIISSDAARQTTVITVQDSQRIEVGKLRRVDKSQVDRVNFYAIVQEDGKEYFYTASK